MQERVKELRERAKQLHKKVESIHRVDKKADELRVEIWQSDVNKEDVKALLESFDEIKKKYGLMCENLIALLQHLSDLQPKEKEDYKLLISEVERWKKESLSNSSK